MSEALITQTIFEKKKKKSRAKISIYSPKWQEMHSG